MTGVQRQLEKEDTEYEKVETWKQEKEREAEEREGDDGLGAGGVADDEELKEEEEEEEERIDQSHCATLLLCEEAEADDAEDGVRLVVAVDCAGGDSPNIQKNHRRHYGKGKRGRPHDA